MSITTKSGKYLSDAELDKLAEACERGEYPGEPTGEILVGRPLKFGEDMKPVTFKETETKIALIDARAAELELSRSDYLRRLVDQDLAAASA